MHRADEICTISHGHARAVSKFDCMKPRIEHQLDLVHSVFWKATLRAHFGKRTKAGKRRCQITSGSFHKCDRLFVQKIAMLN
ncbi:hypothetical protein D3C80_1844460 [compost metagenome]